MTTLTLTVPLETLTDRLQDSGWKPVSYSTYEALALFEDSDQLVRSVKSARYGFSPSRRDLIEFVVWHPPVGSVFQPFAVGSLGDAFAFLTGSFGPIFRTEVAVETLSLLS
jgi:hypothetical protein